MPSLFAADNTTRTPVFVLTGFLGSGKTTLLNRLLRAPALADTAVIVNELGEVALDHLLVERLQGEVALLKSGCICCAVRGDFEDTLRELLARRDEGSLPPFARVVVETTGLADPAPLVQAVQTNPLLAHFCSLGAVLTTVDAVNAPAQLERQWEARKQVALADWLLVTKADLVAEAREATAASAAAATSAVTARTAAPAAASARARLDETLRALNPTARWRVLDGGAPLPAGLLEVLPTPRAVHEAVGLLDDAARGWAARPVGKPHGEVRSFVLEADAPLDWPRLHDWLARLRAQHGERLLRLKGVVSVAGEPAPLVLHGVQHLFHPPVSAPGIDWPAGRSAIVLVVRGLDEARASEGFEDCRAA